MKDLPERVVSVTRWAHCPSNSEGLRIECWTEDDAIAYRKETGCGGWVLGCYLFVGSWTPSAVMLSCDVEGVLR